MHLGLTLPSVFYENHLKAKNYEVSGVTAPGLPLVQVGHNAHIAWGATVAYTDCDDLFIERFDPDSPMHYEWDWKWFQAKVIEEEIHIKGRKNPHVEKILYTRHGPIISSLFPSLEKPLALQSKALQSFSLIKGWYELNCAKNWNEFVHAMRFIKAPQLNMTYADKEGNIGHWVTGEVPIRGEGRGLLPLEGWTKDSEWEGNIPFEEMPHALNPKEGFLVSCNNRIIGEDYPYDLGHIWMSGYRAKRVREVLEKKEKVNLKDCGKLQIDFFCLPGLEFKEKLKNFSSKNEKIKKALAILKDWDGVLNTQSIGGSLYEMIRYHLTKNILDPVLGEDLSQSIMGEGFHPLLLPKSEYYGHDTINLLRLLDHPTSWWFEKAGGYEKVIEKSIVDSLSWLEENLGKKRKKMEVGKYSSSIISACLWAKKTLGSGF